MLCIVLAWASQAKPFRVAYFSTELSRDGPGLLLRDILKGKDAQVAAVVDVVTRADADVLILSDIDYDLGGAALIALSEQFREAGTEYLYHFAAQPNTGRPTGFDLDGDGRVNRAADAQGWGLYQGQGGLAVLSKWPILNDDVQDFSSYLWRDLPDATVPVFSDGTPYYAAAVFDQLPLASVAQWDVPIGIRGGEPVSFLVFKASPPVFDGPEDRNGLRNADQLNFWRHYLDRRLPAMPRYPIVLTGTANVDPYDGEGRRDALRKLLDHAAIQDPAPTSAGALVSPSPGQAGDPAYDTVDWWEEDEGPGNLRVDYVLPGAAFKVLGHGVQWSDPSTDPGAAASEAAASRHRLVWVDLMAP